MVMKIDEIIGKLEEDYPDNKENIDKIKDLLNQINGLDNKTTIEPLLEEIQQHCNTLNNTQTTEALIELQIIINEYRYKYDITDPREVINWDNGRGYVQ